MLQTVTSSRTKLFEKELQVHLHLCQVHLYFLFCPINHWISYFRT